MILTLALSVFIGVSLRGGFAWFVLAMALFMTVKQLVPRVSSPSSSSENHS